LVLLKSRFRRYSRSWSIRRGFQNAGQVDGGKSCHTWGDLERQCQGRAMLRPPKHLESSMAASTDVWPRGTPRVGDSASRSRAITARDIELFTAISGDNNPLHYDEAAAKRSKFGAIVVQGGVTSAILNAVVAEELPGPGTVFLQVNWSFKAPVRPGDTITGHVEVTSVREDKPITELKTSVTRDDGTLVIEGTAVCYTFAL
jgi:acyl dehydratase